ncbi:MAG TPA: gluconate 2-dehydrogenase subunit 3 family protein [Solirubrobacteraceae bacterium]|nr:gluconate 2-dehydrogenase subunit 3 family protein [Solirubrobacteraceae bacterium]
MPLPVNRRTFVGTGVLALGALMSPAQVSALVQEVVASGRGRFLSAEELQSLRAVTARLVPGPPDDPGPGALEVHAAEAIDLLLGAFELDPPKVHAGGPFSGRDGGSRDDFSHFVPMDRLAELAWRIRLEGSRGLPEREFAGPVVGLQQIYRSGLARLDGLARARGGSGFASVSGTLQDELLATKEQTVERFFTAALANTLEALCGPPEYGGNHALAGWRGLHWLGDRQPRGFSAKQVTEPDPPLAADVSPGASAALRANALRRIAPKLVGTSASQRWPG